MTYSQTGWATSQTGQTKIRIYKGGQNTQSGPTQEKEMYIGRVDDTIWQPHVGKMHTGRQITQSGQTHVGKMHTGR